MPWEYEQPTKMPSTTEIAAAIAVRYVDQCGKPEKKTASKSWGELFHSVFVALGFMAAGALFVWWGWMLALPLVLHYTTNVPTVTFGRAFGALLVLRGLHRSITGGVFPSTFQLRLVK